MQDLTTLLNNDEKLAENLCGFYENLYNYFEEEKAVLTTLFTLPDISLTKLNEEAITLMVLEVLEEETDIIIQGGSVPLKTFELNYIINTANLSRITTLFESEGMTLINGLKLVNDILKERFDFGDEVTTGVHLDTHINRVSREVEFYYLQIKIYKQ